MIILGWSEIIVIVSNFPLVFNESQEGFNAEIVYLFCN